MTADEPYQIVVARPAARTIAEELPESVAAAVVELITGPLLNNPRRLGVALRNELDGLWSVRRGTYRFVYRIDDARREVVVLRVLEELRGRSAAGPAARRTGHLA